MNAVNVEIIVCILAFIKIRNFFWLISLHNYIAICDKSAKNLCLKELIILLELH